MRTGLQVGLCLALLAALPLTVHAQSEADFWRKTNLSREFVAKFINNEKCQSNETYLRSCRAALRAGEILAHADITPSAMEFEDSIHRLEALQTDMPVQMLRAKVINAYLTTYDTHAALKPSAMMDESFASENQNYVGIGVVLEPVSEGLIVTEVSKDSPASKTGIREDDIVLAIAKNGRKFENVGRDLGKAAELILGPSAASLTLKIQRAGNVREFSMSRDVVHVPYVTSEIVDGIGYMRIYSFASYKVCPQVIAQLADFQLNNVKKMILDLRGNPGGEKAMSICVAELFLGPYPVVGSKNISNAIPDFNTIMNLDPEELTNDSILWEGGYVARAKYNGSLVVLIDARSASGSEIVAGALQDYQRAWLVGERSFGKGSVQAEEFVPDHPSLSLKWTIERFYQPLGRTNQGVGISPNFEVPRRKDIELSSVQREGDLAPESSLWQETRSDEAQRIRECIESAQSADKNLDILSRRGNPPDYQMSYALAVLQCL